MALLSSIAFALFAVAAATEVQQCPGRSFTNLQDNVQLSPCMQTPCILKKGTKQKIKITFTPDTDLTDVRNKVQGEVFGIPLPFVGVDGNSICEKITTEDGTKAPCPLKAGTKYIYTDSFPILNFYPTVKVKVIWSLLDPKTKDIICFEVPSKIQ